MFFFSGGFGGTFLCDENFFAMNIYLCFFFCFLAARFIYFHSTFILAVIFVLRTFFVLDFSASIS